MQFLTFSLIWCFWCYKWHSPCCQLCLPKIMSLFFVSLMHFIIQCKLCFFALTILFSFYTLFHMVLIYPNCNSFIWVSNSSRSRSLWSTSSMVWHEWWIIHNFPAEIKCMPLFDIVLSYNPGVWTLCTFSNIWSFCPPSHPLPQLNVDVDSSKVAHYSNIVLGGRGFGKLNNNFPLQNEVSRPCTQCWCTDAIQICPTSTWIFFSEKQRRKIYTTRWNSRSRHYIFNPKQCRVSSIGLIRGQSFLFSSVCFSTSFKNKNLYLKNTVLSK